VRPFVGDSAVRGQAKAQFRVFLQQTRTLEQQIFG
jgi:hypothetical protein